ncbi:hypothetical protein BKA70DRAFT_1421964 [Coprinopsis sp. MPI-PUGE-AT-0042]|nr:hypothetical protein BKA70DRAFT_1421964 [Coprinopsis sp. MPI-PUGE-AT-0042]
MPPITRSGQQPQRWAKSLKPARPLPEDRTKSSRTRLYWEGRNKAEERRDHRYFLTLECLLLLHGEDLSKITAAVRGHVETMVWKGQVMTWSADLGSTQSLISRRLGVVLSGQGFKDDIIGRLLCPVEFDWLSDDTKDTLRSTPQSILVGSWPIVFYQNMEFERRRPWEGFLRNSLLVMTYKHIFRASSRCELSTRRPVSINSIAYVATLVTAALSGPDTYKRTENQLLFHKHLFNILTDHMDEHRDTFEVKDLVLWWDRQFRGVQKTSDATGWITNRLQYYDNLKTSRGKA